MPEKSSQHSGDKEAKSAAEEEQWKAPGDEESGEGTGWIELPDEADFWRPPARFGSIPVEKEPMGWDKRQGYRKHFPRISLPFQVVERVPFGRPDLNPNRLFWGDNLQIMRGLDAESVDLIYLDPPFFSQRNYSIVWGDSQEVRSFSDVWKDGLNGYLTWLNARIEQAKRLLKLTGSLYLHCDWHAGHYIKVELDKIFGYHNFRNEIIWRYTKWTNASKYFQRNHDCILFYAKNAELAKFNKLFEMTPHKQKVEQRGWASNIVEGGVRQLLVYNREKAKREIENPKYDRIVYRDDAPKGTAISDNWIDINYLAGGSKERLGYPTQKPEALLERIIQASSNEGDVVGDFFCGGGTTPAVAQRLNRRFIACDQSRVAVSVTRDRLIAQAEQMKMDEQTGKVSPTPDFTVENWGVYEAKGFAKMPPKPFRAFALKRFAARAEERDAGIHGWKGPVPIWVGSPKPKERVSAAEVKAFANAVRKTARYKQTNLREGIMLAWAFRADAKQAAEQLRKLEEVDFHFMNLTTAGKWAKMISR